MHESQLVFDKQTLIRVGIAGLPYSVNTRKAPTDKKAPIRNFMHYSEPSEDQSGITVFGSATPGLQYHYDDRLSNYGDWQNCLLLAAKFVPGRNTAEYYEKALGYMFPDLNFDIQHIVLGCNRANGFHWLCFGFTATKKEQK
jgi:hypothetical protein